MSLSHAAVGAVELMVAKKKVAGKPLVPPLDSAEALPSISLPQIDDGVGSRIRQAREGKGWTQLVLSNRTRFDDPEKKGISRTVIVGYEAGTHKPGAREIRLLCEALHVTPNWLLFGTENPFEVLQPSMAITRTGGEMHVAMRLAFSMLLLKPHERDLASSLILSFAGREVGDLRLSGLMWTADQATKEALNQLQKYIPEGVDAMSLKIRDLIELASREFESNFGNRLKLDEDGEKWEGEWLYKDPAPSDRTK